MMMTQVMTYSCDFSTSGLSTVGDDSMLKPTAFYSHQHYSTALAGTCIKTDSEVHILGKKQRRWNAWELGPGGGLGRRGCYWWACPQRELWDTHLPASSPSIIFSFWPWVIILLGHVIPSPCYLIIGPKQWGQTAMHWSKLKAFSL